MENLKDILNLFSNRLKEIMKENNFNITTFAEFVEIPRTTVNSWILNKKVPRLDYLFKIANKFNITLDYLVGREDI